MEHYSFNNDVFFLVLGTSFWWESPSSQHRTMEIHDCFLFGNAPYSWAVYLDELWWVYVVFFRGWQDLVTRFCGFLGVSQNCQPVREVCGFACCLWCVNNRNGKRDGFFRDVESTKLCLIIATDTIWQFQQAQLVDDHRQVSHYP